MGEGAESVGRLWRTEIDDKKKPVAKAVTAGLATGFFVISGLGNGFASANEYSCAMKLHFRKSGNQMSGKWKSSYASLLNILVR